MAFVTLWADDIIALYYDRQILERFTDCRNSQVRFLVFIADLTGPLHCRSSTIKFAFLEYRSPNKKQTLEINPCGLIISSLYSMPPLPPIKRFESNTGVRDLSDSLPGVRSFDRPGVFALGGRTADVGGYGKQFAEIDSRRFSKASRPFGGIGEDIRVENLGRIIITHRQSIISVG